MHPYYYNFSFSNPYFSHGIPSRCDRKLERKSDSENDEDDFTSTNEYYLNNPAPKSPLKLVCYVIH